MTDNRRRESRVEVLGQVQGGIDVLDLPVTVREMSLHGLGMETAREFPAGAVHEFRLTLGDGSFVQIRGRVMHCRKIVTPDSGARYLSGVRFIDDDTQDAGPAN